MNCLRKPPSSTLGLLLLSLLGLPAYSSSVQQNKNQTEPQQSPKFDAPKQTPSTKPLSETAQLQIAIDRAGNDRASLVRNLEEFLQDYPESRQRPQIYRALVEACLQLRDSVRAADYAERIVALTPEDMPMTMLAIQLLERNGDEPALRRAFNYSTRVLDYINRSSAAEKSPKISKEEWETEQKREKTNILSLRGRLSFKLQHGHYAIRSGRRKARRNRRTKKRLTQGHQGIRPSLCARGRFRWRNQSPRNTPETRERLAARAWFRSRPRRLPLASLRRHSCLARRSETKTKRQRQRALRFHHA